MANPLVKLAVTGSGIAAAMIGRSLASAGWGAVFGEDPPSEQYTKDSAKETKKRRKQAKKDGLSKAEIAEIRDPAEDVPWWKAILWTIVSGVLLQGLRAAAQNGAKKGADRLTRRRPRPNRG